MNTQSGRSMVEMLGVLAIIGVLSVGAIAGYSKAMMKYKLNKQAEQISWLLNVMYRYKSEFGKNPPSMSFVPYFIKLGEIPEDMITDNETLHDVFNSKIMLQTNDCSTGRCYQTIIRYFISSSEKFETCQNVFTVAKAFNEHLDASGVYRSISANPEYGNFYYGSRYCTNGKKCIKDMTQEQIYNQCRFCTEGSSGCTIFFTFRID